MKNSDILEGAVENLEEAKVFLEKLDLMALDIQKKRDEMLKMIGGYEAVQLLMRSFEKGLGGL